MSNTPLPRRAFLGRMAALTAATLPGAAGTVAAGPVGVTAQLDRRELSLANGLVRGVWAVDDGRLRALRLEVVAGPRVIPLAPDVFTLVLAGGDRIASSVMRLVGGVRRVPLAARPVASRAAERLEGQAIEATLRHEATGVTAVWRAVLRDGATYLRQEVTLRGEHQPVPIAEITMVDLPLRDAAVAGEVRGSPIVAGGSYAALEHPLAHQAVEGGRARAWLPRELPLRPGTALLVSSVVGAAPAGQLRRGFLEYVERERAHPYRTFLHYNSWYDIGYFSKYDEAAALGVIAAFGEELVRKRSVTLDSFLFDDGWDDPTTLWSFHEGFPNGFMPLTEAATRVGAAPGVWLSPWGGYGKPREERVRYGEARGYETIDGRFALSGPRYYERFLNVCLRFVRRYGVNQFKIDGTGNADRAVPGSQFDSDFDAAIALIQTLRAEKPDLYVNLTTGTYPSPFWLWHADSIWRGGEDHDFAGVGSDRQQWMTYRDAATYQGVVRRGPLFPLNSLMLHGLIFARSARKLNGDPADDFRDEVRSYFATGTQLQEMYVTPALLSQTNWDDVAEAATWSRRNADVLRDTHWVGGDPAALEVYGWSSWTPRLGIITLRNPSDRPQTLPLDVADAFELPEGAPQRYRLRRPWRDATDGAVTVRTGTPHVFRLDPFQVKTLEATPV